MRIITVTCNRMPRIHNQIHNWSWIFSCISTYTCCCIKYTVMKWLEILCCLHVYNCNRYCCLYSIVLSSHSHRISAFLSVLSGVTNFCLLWFIFSLISSPWGTITWTSAGVCLTALKECFGLMDFFVVTVVGAYFLRWRIITISFRNLLLLGILLVMLD